MVEGGYENWPNPVCPYLGKSMVGSSSKIVNAGATAGTNAAIPLGVLALILTFVVCVVLICRPGDKEGPVPTAVGGGNGTVVTGVQMAPLAGGSSSVPVGQPVAATHNPSVIAPADDQLP